MICVPIVAKYNHEALQKMEAADKMADLIELRIDYLSAPDLPMLLSKKTGPVIVTCRAERDRGKWSDPEEERVKMLVKALELGADYVDVEIAAPTESIRKIVDAAGDPGRVIVSYHNFDKTPDDLESIKDGMVRAVPGAIIKIATWANSVQDALLPLTLLKGKNEGEKVAAFCMGEHGEISRVLSPMFGGEFTFGSLSAGDESAPGQIPASVLRDIYRVGELNQDTEIYGLIGNPVKESMGYLIHNKSYIRMGMNRVYLPFLVQDLNGFINAFKGVFKGASVTMPFKEDIIPLLDEVDPTARNIGAVNTIDARGGKLIGYNTDSSGAVKALEELTPLAGKTVLMIGAGGVARAVGFGAVSKGASIVISDIDTHKAALLAGEMGGKVCPPDKLNDVDYDILANCSPIGMHPKVDATPFPREFFKQAAVVFDVIYNPLKTRLLREAAEAGCRTIRGVELFVNQAVDQFELWTEEKAPKEVMAEVVLNKLMNRSL